MNRSLLALACVAAVVIAAALILRESNLAAPPRDAAQDLSHRGDPVASSSGEQGPNGGGTVPTQPESTQAALTHQEEAAAPDSTAVDSTAVGAGAAKSKASASGSPAVWPPNVEDRIWAYLAQADISATSILSVHCGKKICEIELTGTEANPKYVDEFSDALVGFYTQGLNVKQGSVSLREKYPGTLVTVISLSNQKPQLKAR